jgi:purine-binding chemotaxis protein CheW
MTNDSTFCLFHCGREPFAVAVPDVVEIVEVESLVPISLCPPPIVGLCPHRRQVVPVVNLSTASEPPELASARIMREARREAVLILRGEQGQWGVRIDRDGTSISAERPNRHEPKSSDDGVVTVGFIPGESVAHRLLDAEATWQSLRAAVLRWYDEIQNYNHDDSHTPEITIYSGSPAERIEPNPAFEVSP